MDVTRRSFLAGALAAGTFASAASANPALQHILRYKRAGATGQATTAAYSTWGTLLALYRASDLASQFSAIAGTGAVANDGDVVGYWSDLSGNNIHITAPADDTRRATHRIINGYRAVEFDGANDILNYAGLAGIFAASGLSVAVALRNNQAQQGTLISESSSSDPDTRYEIIRNNGSDFNDSTGFIRNNAAGIDFTTSVIKDEAFPGVSTDVVYIVTDSGTTLKGYSDNVIGSDQIYARTGSYSALDRFTIGARGDASSFCALNVHAIAIYSGVLSSTNRAGVNTLMGLEQGRTI